MKRWGKRTVFVCLLTMVLSLSTGVYADDAVTVVGMQMNDSYIGLFLHGLGDTDPSAEISNWVCESSGKKTLDEANLNTYTFFLVDVSTSVRKESREQIKAFIDQLIADKPENDYFAIAVFGESSRVLIDFTRERYDLSRALDGMVWQEQQSSIYEAVQLAAQNIQKVQEKESVFAQLVVFSDGMEDTDSGIIKEELFMQLQKAYLPVHTVGFKYDKNTEGLKEFYAFSRITGGVIQEVANQDSIPNNISTYASEVSWVQYKLPDAAKDGTVRPFTLYDSSGSSLFQCNLNMPYAEPVASTPEPTTEPTAQPTPEVTSEPTIAPTQEPEKTEGVIGMKTLALILAIVLVLIAGIAVFTVIMVKKKKPPVPDENYKEKEQEYRTEMDIGGDYNATELLIQDGLMRKNGGAIKLVLNDLDQPHKRFETIMDKKVEVGRAPKMPGIVIDYDKRISQRHFMVTQREGNLWLEDLGSTNNTFVNGEMIKSARMIRDNDVVTCGKTRLSVRIEKS